MLPYNYIKKIWSKTACNWNKSLVSLIENTTSIKAISLNPLCSYTRVVNNKRIFVVTLEL